MGGTNAAIQSIIEPLVRGGGSYSQYSLSRNDQGLRFINQNNDTNSSYSEIFNVRQIKSLTVTPISKVHSSFMFGLIGLGGSTSQPEQLKAGLSESKPPEPNIVAVGESELKLQEDLTKKHVDQIKERQGEMEKEIKINPQAKEIANRFHVVRELQRNLTMIGRDLEDHLVIYENAKRPTASLIPNFLDNVYRKAANTGAGIGHGSEIESFGNVENDNNNSELDSEFGLGPKGPGSNSSSSSSSTNDNLSWGDLSEIATRILQATPSTNDINQNEYFGEEIDDNGVWTAKMAEHHDAMKKRIEQLEKITNLSIYRKYDTLF